MFKDFRKFILRGNVVDLAVAVVIGAAFTAVVQALVRDMVTPLIAAVGGKPDFSNLYFTVNNSRFMYGDLINALISFLMVAAVIFFFVVQPVNKLVAYSQRNADAEEPNEKKCPQCMSEIHKDATRCPFCTSKI